MKHLKLFAMLALIVLLGLFAMRALVHSGFYTSHDGWHQVARLFHFDQALRDGQFPPRWSGHLLFNFGYPIFLFSYHLPWWIAEPLVLLGFSIFDAIKFVFVLTFVLSGVTMFLWIRNMWGYWAGFIAAFIYMYTPYRFATVLVRANIGEAVSFMFFPLLFWSLYRLHLRRSTTFLILGAASITGLLLSHVMVVFLFALPGVLYYVYLLFTTGEKRRFVLQTFVMGILGVSLSAYYLLPALFYKGITVFQETYHGLYQAHFTSLSKLLYSPWGYAAIGVPIEMSRQVGLVIWLLIAGLVLFVLISLFKKSQQKNELLFGLFLLFSFCWSVFLMLKNSQFLWKLIEPMTLVDFPWRLLAVTTFIGSIAAGFLISRTRSKFLMVGLFVFLFGSAWVTNRNHQRVNEYTDIPLSLYVVSETTTNTDDEYLPKWVDRQEVRKENQPLLLGKADFDNLEQDSMRISFAYSSKEQTSINIRHMNFPGWRATIDGVHTDIERSDFGGMRLLVPQGTHQVLLEFQQTPVMMAGNGLTLLSLLFLILISRKQKILGTIK
ncbi:hypothetical protein C4564_00555 [Candidatus Microgenomates bacterium]|nr:MAG: hypothetical protein C4564_00555 [Candidatus Microgenomates bacterium]